MKVNKFRISSRLWNITQLVTQTTTPEHYFPQKYLLSYSQNKTKNQKQTKKQNKKILKTKQFLIGIYKQRNPNKNFQSVVLKQELVLIWLFATSITRAYIVYSSCGWVSTTLKLDKLNIIVSLSWRGVVVPLPSKCQQEECERLC